MGKVVNKSKKTNLLEVIIPVLAMAGIAIGLLLTFLAKDFLEYGIELILSILLGTIVYILVSAIFRSQGYKKASASMGRRNGNFIKNFLVEFIERTHKLAGLIAVFIAAYLRIFKSSIEDFFQSENGQDILFSSPLYCSSNFKFNHRTLFVLQMKPLSKTVNILIDATLILLN